jgi:hypothetical protein
MKQMSKDKKTPWQELLNRPMTRKQFLGLVAVGVFTVVGLGPLVKALTQDAKKSHDENPVYGGEQAHTAAPTKRA